MLNTLINISGKKLLLPFYHVVSDNNPVHLRNLYKVRTIDCFKLDLEYILKYYKPILVDDLLEHQTIKENSVLFTFDDGLREINDVIAPILKQKGIPAVFFVNSAFVDNKDLFYRYKASLLIEQIKSNQITDKQIKEINKKLDGDSKNTNDISKQILNIDFNTKCRLDEIAEILNCSFDDYLNSNQPYISLEQLKSLVTQGFSIGAHSVDHPEYYKISIEEQIKQTTESLDWVKSNLIQKYNLFAFPFTDFQVSRRFFETIFNKEKQLVDLSFGTAGIKDDFHPKHLQRIPIEESNETAEKIITKEYLAYIAKKIIRKNRIKRN